MIAFDTTVHRGLPRLAWYARYSIDQSTVHVVHGHGVEVQDRFAVEGVWDGEFNLGGFDLTPNFFGSGLIVAEDNVVLVPSRALVDRLLLCTLDGESVVANSLPLLLAATGTRLDSAHDYLPEAFAILEGVRNYSRDFRVLDKGGNPVSCQQLFYSPVVLRKCGQVRIAPPLPAPSFDDYEDYIVYHAWTLRRIADNAHCSVRRTPLRLVTTTSSGYDSTAVSVLAKELGTEIAYTQRRSNSTIPRWLSRAAAIDDGTPIARCLDYEVRTLESVNAIARMDELELLSVSPADTEAVFHSMARDLGAENSPAVVFTGYHGDKVWARTLSEKYLSTDLIRGDTSGLNLSEIRLHSGFINVPVPFNGAAGIRSIHQISNSAEMAPWRLETEYDRPVARRIVETAGVPRHAFGTRKKAVVQTYPFPWNRELRNEFFAWLARVKGVTPLDVRLSTLQARLRFYVLRLAERPAKLLGIAVPGPVIQGGLFSQLALWLHHWAVDRLKQWYALTLGDKKERADR